ncbi:MAG: hypothetical protein AAGU14_09110 [Eubacteriaceae bacterium]
MIGTGYRKLAEELSLSIKNNVAYGIIQDYMTTLSEGIGYKDIYISACIYDETKDIIEKSLSETETKKKYRITEYQITDKSVYIKFFDNPGTMKCIKEFVEWFYPFLKQAGALGKSYCTECKQTLNKSVCKFINNKAVLLHEYCAEKIAEGIKEQIKNNNEKSNLLKGFLGSLLGGVIGAIPWAIVYSFGWFVGWLGLLIGFLAQKGYYLFGGKSKKATIAILSAAIIIAVIFAQILGDCVTLGRYIINGEITEFALKDIPYIIYSLFISDKSYVADFIQNVLYGLVFAALGAYQILKKVSKRVTEENPNIKDEPQDI